MRYSTVLQLIQDWSLWLPSPWTNQSSTRFQGAIGMPLAMAAIASPPQAPEAVETVDAEQDSQGNSNSGEVATR
jgi:uncharacterized membrane protein (DUF2068 family)